VKSSSIIIAIKSSEQLQAIWYIN